MVTVKACHSRTNPEGETYASLELVGQIELVQSQNTGRFYATARRCFIYSTLDAETSKQIVGTTFPGNIVRTACDPYEYKLPESGKSVVLSHRYTYMPDEASTAAQPKTPVLVHYQD